MRSPWPGVVDAGEHPDTLGSANNDLAGYLSRQGKYADAERMLHATFASIQRVFGPAAAHPNTLTAARRLEEVRALIRATPPTTAAAPVAAGTARPLPDGTRGIVQHCNGSSESPSPSTTASARACCRSTRAPASMTCQTWRWTMGRSYR